MYGRGHLALEAVAVTDEGQPHRVQDVEAVAEPQVALGQAWPWHEAPLLLRLPRLLHETLEPLCGHEMLGRLNVQSFALGDMSRHLARE